MRRRPDDWNGALPQFKDQSAKDVYAVETIVSGDGTHPSNPARYVNDFSEEALSHNGYTLRNYMTLRTYYLLLSRIFQSPSSTLRSPYEQPPPSALAVGCCGQRTGF